MLIIIKVTMDLYGKEEKLTYIKLLWDLLTVRKILNITLQIILWHNLQKCFTVLVLSVEINCAFFICMVMITLQSGALTCILKCVSLTEFLVEGETLKHALIHQGLFCRAVWDQFVPLGLKLALPSTHIENTHVFKYFHA